VISKVVRFIETKVGEGENGELINEYSVSVLQDERVLEMDGADDCTAMRIYLIPLNCTLKN